MVGVLEIEPNKAFHLISKKWRSPPGELIIILQDYGGGEIQN